MKNIKILPFHLVVFMSLLLTTNCGVIHRFQPSEICLQNMTRVPYDSMRIERIVSLGKWATAFMYGKTWNSQTGVQTLKVRKSSDYKFGPMFIFSLPSFKREYSESVTLCVSLPTDTALYDGNNMYHRMILGFGNSTKRVLAERILKIVITPEILPVIQQIERLDDGTRRIRLSYRATGHPDPSGKIDLSEEHDSLHFGCWDKFYEIQINAVKTSNAPGIPSVSDFRFVQSNSGILRYETSTGIPCVRLYKVLVFLPPHIDKYSEQATLSCTLTGKDSASGRDCIFPIIAAANQPVARQDTFVCRLDREMADKISALIKQ
jgi:hypothetical protein